MPMPPSGRLDEPTESGAVSRGRSDDDWRAQMKAAVRFRAAKELDISAAMKCGCGQPCLVGALLRSVLHWSSSSA